MTVLRGYVNAQRQPVVSITICGSQGREVTVDAILDTGFNGTLCLPPHLVLELGLPFWFSCTVMLADGSTQDVSNHRGRILWESVERPTRIVASGDQPLLGMGLLIGYRIRVDAVDGGEVVIEPL